jgi:GT2 family glycosyltransferase
MSVRGSGLDKAMPRVVISIVTFNSASDIGRLVEQILGCIEYGDYTIHIRDNGSTDVTPVILNDLASRNERVSVTLGANVGFGRAHNEILNSDGEFDIAILLNPDMEVKSDIVAELSGFFPFDIVAPNVFNEDGSSQRNEYSFSSPTKVAAYEFAFGKYWGSLFRAICTPTQDDWMRREVDWISGCCMGISRRAFEKLNGFDERIFLYCEDEELCWRAHQLGLKVERINTSNLIHSLGWHKNWLNPLTRRYLFESHRYMYAKVNAHRPIRHFMLQALNLIRFWKYEMVSKAKGSRIG